MRPMRCSPAATLVGRNFHAFSFPVATPRKLQRLAGMRADRGDQGVPGVDPLVVGAHDAVAGREAGALGRVAGDDLADHRLERRPEKAQADALQRRRVSTSSVG